MKTVCLLSCQKLSHSGFCSCANQPPTLFPTDNFILNKSYDLFSLSSLFPFCKSQITFHFHPGSQRIFTGKLSKKHGIHELLCVSATLCKELIKTSQDHSGELYAVSCLWQEFLQQISPLWEKHEEYINYMWTRSSRIFTGFVFNQVFNSHTTHNIPEACDSHHHPLQTNFNYNFDFCFNSLGLNCLYRPSDTDVSNLFFLKTFYFQKSFTYTHMQFLCSKNYCRRVMLRTVWNN